MTDRLSALDLSFLHMERPGLPIHVGSVGIFEAGPLRDDDGQFRLADLRAEIESRLDVLPRLRRRLAWPPLSIARPCWVDDDGFDIARHVDAVELGRGDDADLRRYAASLFAEVLPRDRPLWHLRFVAGLHGDRVALVERVHHALVDGVSGVDVAAVLLDLAPDAPRHEPSSWAPAPPTSASLTVDAVASRAADALSAARAVGSTLVHPVRASRGVLELADGLVAVVGDGFRAPGWSLNAPVGPTRRLGWLTTRLDEVKAAGRAHGATANDVVLTAVAAGLRDLFLRRGELLAPDAAVKVLVPVSLRDASGRGVLGNQVGALLVRLPIGIGDPGERLAAVAAATTRAKRHREASISAALLGAADVVPAWLVGPIARAVHRQPLVNVVVTNVPGPSCPLYAAGARMLSAFPVVPLGGNLTVGVAILSYDGVLHIGITADADQCPDVDLLQAGIERGFVALGAWSGPPDARSIAPDPSTTIASIS